MEDAPKSFGSTDLSLLFRKIDPREISLKGNPMKIANHGLQPFCCIVISLILGLSGAQALGNGAVSDRSPAIDKYKYAEALEKNAKNEAEAAIWYRKAAAEGLAAAQYKMSRIEKNKEASFEWLKKSASQGYAEAELSLAYEYSKSNQQLALQYVFSAASKGHEPALTVIPLYCMGVAQEFAQQQNYPGFFRQASIAYGWALTLERNNIKPFMYTSDNILAHVRNVSMMLAAMGMSAPAMSTPNYEMPKLRKDYNLKCPRHGEYDYRFGTSCPACSAPKFQ